ncbi:unnamed protein product [Dovyalis caffra]|uniref:Uncharacterized protein n=1 Tax=Dovyalis caffra TaxID=77055 RepID=A0AAV1RWW3_9ROSI|nr:unnamed protein product [Dovyalis caffra]
MGWNRFPSCLSSSEAIHSAIQFNQRTDQPCRRMLLEMASIDLEAISKKLAAQLHLRKAAIIKKSKVNPSKIDLQHQTVHRFTQVKFRLWETIRLILKRPGHR